MAHKRKRTVPTREEFVALIDRATVPESEWHNRDSAGAQRQMGEGRALLLSGCKYAVEPGNEHDCWWLEITYKGFDYFEIGELTTDTFYIPTAERLDKADGEDWY